MKHTFSILIIASIAVLIFAATETILVLIALNHSIVGQRTSPFGIVSVPLAFAGWSVLAGLIAATAWWKKSYASPWKNTGIDKGAYNLMIRMRGGVSRLNLLRTLEVPRHRNELSELTGIDWKEVNRQIGLLQKYGLVSVHSQSGIVKLYKTTEQGKLLIQLVEELNDKSISKE